MRKVIFFLFILLFSTAVSAQNGALNPVVAPDGTIFVMRPGSGGTAPVLPSLIAVSRTGVALWTWEGNVRMHAVAFDATQIFVTSMTGSTSASGTGMHAGMNGGMNGGMRGGRGMLRGGSDSIVALSVANGSERWRHEFDGAVSGLQVAGGRLYVVVHATGAGTVRGGMSSEITLVSLDAATGTTIWTTPMP